ncbi:MAG: competence type IV pilus major pilin ComGC [Erysipelotrichaceae bacterium]
MNKKGFTMLEMIIVLSIICLIFVLTLPNIVQKQKIINDKGCLALVEVVNSQILLYKLNEDAQCNSVNELVEKGYLKPDQVKCYDGKNVVIENGEAKIQ